MMKPLAAYYYVFLCGICVFAVHSSIPCVSARGINGGMKCATCTVLIGLVEQLAEVHNETVTQVLSEVCSWLPSKFLSGACKTFLKEFGPYIIEMLDAKYTSDTVCYVLGICYQENADTPKCHLFPKPKEGFEQSIELGRRRFHFHKNQTADPCSIPGIEQLCKWLADVFNQHVPGWDQDADNYSTLLTLRGSAWRGKDCHDDNPLFYPGRSPLDDDKSADSNCNGIQGMNPLTGMTFEKEFCGDSHARGVVVLGDSVGAHFHLPPQWFTASQLNQEILSNLTEVLSNEADWPHLSFGTGYAKADSATIFGPVDSIYLRIRERNLCNHRDYHNLAVNGGNSFNVLNYMKALSRTPTDRPVLLILELVGNDVCNNIPDTVSNMTTPEEMHTNIMEGLQYLDKRLANGSHVLIIGLADGRFLYDSMHDRFHPIGQLRKDVKYSDMYDWFNCMQVTPCYGWLNNDAWYRNATTYRAKQLNAVLKDITLRYKFHHFDMRYIDCPIEAVVREWIAKGGKGWELIEPVDGFHPNQEAHSLAAAKVWKTLQTIFPEALGPTNPDNYIIKKIFGDQGGH